MKANSSTGRPRWLRFSLRGLLLLTTALCAFFSWRTYHESKLRHLDQRLDELKVYHKLVRAEVPQLQLLVFGPAAFTRIDDIQLRDDHFRDGRLQEIVDLVSSWHVREVSFDYLTKPVNRDSYEQIARLQSLERIVFDHCEPGEESDIQPLAKLPRLKEISIEITWGIQRLPLDFYLSLPNLKVLGLPSWSDEQGEYVARRRPDLQLQVTDFPP